MLYNKRTALQSRLSKRTKMTEGETAAHATEARCNDLIKIFEEEMGVCCRDRLISQLEGLPSKRIKDGTQSDLVGAFKGFLDFDEDFD